MVNDPDADTLPPNEDSLAGHIAELKAALTRSNELTILLLNRLTLVELAEITQEARSHVASLAIDDLNRRVGVLEGLAAE